MSTQATLPGLMRERAAGISLLRRAGRKDRPPLVLLHGIGSDALTWVPLIDALDPAVEVIAWDAPGYGTSDALTIEAPTPMHYADALAAMLDALGHRRVVMIGHSLGSLFAGRFAAAHPDRLLGVALFSPALGYRHQAGTPLQPNLQARINDLVRLGAVDFAATRAARLVYRPETKPDIVANVRRAMAAVQMPGYGHAVHALAAGDLLADAATIAVPTFVGVGAEDVVTPPAGAHALHAVIRKPAGFEEVAAAGHALPQEDPKAVAQMLASFTRELIHV